MTSFPLLLKAVRESRLDISQEYKALCEELDLQKKFKHSVKKHPLFWLAGAAGAGFLTTIFGAKRTKNQTAQSRTTAPLVAAPSLAKVGWLAGALEIGKLLYPVLRPVVVKFAQKSIQSTLAKNARSK